MLPDLIKFKKMKKKYSIKLCQPDHNKGCTACCGLFNFNDISKEYLTNYLIKGHSGIKSYYNNCWNKNNLRDITSHICHYQGFINKSKPGCVIHPVINKKDIRDISLFGKKICNSYLCPAHVILSDRQKKILINYIDDWYYYSICIIDPDSFIWILNTIHKELNTDEDIILKKENSQCRDLLSKSLNIHSGYLSKNKLPLVFYSVSEYNLGKVNFSLSGNSPKIMEEKNLIRRAIQNSEINYGP